MNRLLLWLGFQHRYRSTGCLHGGEGHDYCDGRSGVVGEKAPGRCKWCAVKCRCRCHKTFRSALHAPAPRITMAIPQGTCPGCRRQVPIVGGKIWPHPDRAADMLGVGPMECEGTGKAPFHGREDGW